MRRLPHISLLVLALLGTAVGASSALALQASLTSQAARSGPAGSPSPSSSPPAAASPTPADPCAAVQQVDLSGGQQSSFPARTLAELLANAPRDPSMRHMLEDIAGVRPGAMGDPRVPRCRVDLLRLGAAVYLRAYPATTGFWLVPVVYGGDTLLTAYVSVDETGAGTVGGSRGGAVPVPTEADARAAGALPGDPVMSAELIAAKPPGCGAISTAVWRLVRSNGTVVYFTLDAYGVTPPGALFEEKDMRFSLGRAGVRGVASVSRAC